MSSALKKENEQLQSQRDRAWLALSKTEDALKAGADAMGIAFALASARNVGDIDEYNAVIEAALAAGK